MITTETVERIRSRLREMGSMPAPQASVARMVIRSGDQLFFRAPLRTKLSSEDQEQLLFRFDPTSVDRNEGDSDEPDTGTLNWGKASKRSLLGPIVVEFGYDIVKTGSGEAKFDRFLSYYEPAMAEFAPNGVRYRGTYVVNLSTEKTAGDYRTIWSFRSVAALNRIGAALQSTAGINPFGALMKRFRSHVDDSPGAGKSQQIYQPAWGTIRGF